MFVGHYGMSFVAKRSDGAIPLWVLFLAVQLLDVVWAPLVLLGVEKVRIVPGYTATNPLDLYYMPYTHSLVAALFLGRRSRRSVHLIAFSLIMLTVQAYVFFGPPPVSDVALALTALATYVVFAWVIWFLIDRRQESR